MTMQPIVFKVALFRDAADQARSQLSMLWMMEALCRVNQSHLRHARGLEERGKGHKYPLLYRAGVHYEREKGTEEWLDIPNVLASASGRPEYPPGAWGDCEDLACWRVSELRERPDKYGGPIKAKPFAKWKLRMNGSYGYHALVLLPNGQLEDPSLTLGMTYERDFQKAGLAQKFKDGVVKPKVRFAALPEVVVVDPERRGGYGIDPEAARAVTGLFGQGDEPALAEGAAGPPPALGVAAFGYNRGEVNESDMQELLTLAKEI